MGRAGVTAAALLIPAFILPIPSPVPAVTGPCPRIIAHRTLMLDRPENTVAGIEAVPATGAAGVEMDVQWSSSSFPVLMHDTTVDRTTDGAGPPASLGLGQLTALSAADYAPWRTDPRFAGTHVPYGWEFMHAAAAGGLDTLLDIHAAPAELGTQKLRIYVSDYFGWAGRTLIMGPVEQIAAMHAWEPGLRYAVIEYNSSSSIRRGESIVAAGAIAYVVPARDVSPAAVAYWHAYGLAVYAWSTDSTAIDTPATWSALRDAGVDGLITNEPVAARAVLCGGAP